MNRSFPTAIVLSTHTTGMALIRSLGESGIPVAALYYDPHDMGYVSRYARVRCRVPHPETQEREFIARLMELAPRLGGGLLMPADDATLVAVSRHKDELAARYRVGCTDWPVTEKYIAKQNTYRIARQAEVPIPRTLTPSFHEEAVWMGRDIEYPCLIKPCQSHLFYARFGRKLFVARDHPELIELCRLAFGSGLQVMLQEYIPGDDAHGVNYNSYIADGRTVAEFTAGKVRQSPEGSGVPCVVVSRWVPRVAEFGRSLLAAMGYSGYSCAEFKLDPRDGVYKLMEVNGRHNRSGLLAYRCGIHFPLIEYTHRVEGRLLSARPQRHESAGRRLAAGYIPAAIAERPSEAGDRVSSTLERMFEENVYWIDLFRDFYQALLTLWRSHRLPAYFLRPYTGRKIYAVCNLRDPGPFAKQIGGLIPAIVRMAVRSLSASSLEKQQPTEVEEQKK